MSASNFWVRGNNLTKHFHEMSQEAGMIMWVHLVAASLKFGRAKIKRDFGQVSIRISPECIEISTSGKRPYQPQSLPLTTKFNCLMFTRLRSTVCIQRRLMRLYSPRGAEFQPISCLRRRTYSAGRPNVGL